MRTEKALSKIVDFCGEAWSERTRRKMSKLSYIAALIVRNVRYRHWDVGDVKLQLEMMPEKKRKKRSTT